jgi:putative MATE family efflux protein
MNRPNMLSDNVASALFRLVLPMIPGTLSIVLFNLADTYFVGQLGAQQLAAMSFSFPVVLISGGLAMGLGIGTSTFVSQSLGRGDKDEARVLSSRAHLLVFGLVLVLSMIGLATIDPLFTSMGATETTLPLIRTYMTIWFLGLPFVLLPMVGMNVLQASGDTKTPGLVLTLAVMLNIGLDPLLIFGIGPFPELGIAGAAWATVIARASSLIIVGAVIIGREKMLTWRLGPIGEILSSWRGILFVGIPAAAANIFLPISIGILTRLISEFGTEAVAGFGAASRIESFALVFTLALSMILTPFVGQNHGAAKPRRVLSAHRVAALFSLAWGAMVLIVFLLASRPIAAAFNDDPAVVSVTSQYLTILGVSYGFLGIVNLTAAAFNGLRKPMSAAGVAALRLFALYVPLAIAGRALLGLPGIFWGAALGNVISGVIAYLWFLRERRKAADGALEQVNDGAPHGPGPAQAAPERVGATAATDEIRETEYNRT